MKNIKRMINYFLNKIHFIKLDEKFHIKKDDKSWYKDGLLHRDDDLPAIEYHDGSKSWYQNGELHRDNGPALIDSFGNEKWYKNGRLHRDNGLPAIIYANGDKEWYQHGQLYRDNNLPEIEYFDGTKVWHKNGIRHRENGLPAITRSDGTEEYWEHGEQITKEESLHRKDMRNLKKDLINDLPKSSIKPPLKKI